MTPDEAPSTSQSSSTPSTSGRAWAALAAILLVAALGFWAAALVAASRAAPPVVVLFAEPSAGSGGVLPLLAMGFDPEDRKLLPLEGRVLVEEGEPATLEEGIARVPLPNTPGRAAARFEGTAAGAAVSLPFEIDVEPRWREGAPPAFIPWTHELKEPTATALAGAPVYPLAGRARSSLPSRALLLEESGVRAIELKPHAAAVALEDGRALRLDRSGLLVELPLAVRPGVAFEARVTAAEAGDYVAALLVDGRLREVTKLALPRGTSEHALRLPDDAPPGALYALHLSRSPFDRNGASALGLVENQAELDAILARLSAIEPFASADDPLLSALREGRVPLEAASLRAVLARAEIPRPLPARIGPSAEAQRAAMEADRQANAARYRTPFRALGLAFSCVVSGLALAFARRRARLSRLLAEQLAEDGVEGEGSGRAAGIAHWLWASLGLLAALALLGVMDLALAFVLDRLPPG